MKRIIKSIICFSVAMALSMTSVLAKDEAITCLENYGIIQGDESGDLKLDENITRAEFTKIVCKLRGIDTDEDAETIFSDVSAGYWASGYINIASGLGIINGYEDGTFKPDNNITYAETAKMLVIALGYEPFAIDNGGYPHGYLMMASRFGVLEGVTVIFNEQATRENVFLLVYNALDTPIMEQTTYGAEAEYMIMDGNNDVPLVTLRMLSGFEEQAQ